MDKILVAYASNSGSTKEVAEFIAAKAAGGIPIDVVDISSVTSLNGYRGVIIAAPMILGIHSSARKFLSKFRTELSGIPHACIFTAMNVTGNQRNTSKAYQITVDPYVSHEPVNPQRLSIKENYALPANYLRPIEKILDQSKPLGVAFMGGKLEMFKLPILQALFVMLIIQAKPGDLRNWELIENWSKGMMQQFVTT